LTALAVCAKTWFLIVTMNAQACFPKATHIHDRAHKCMHTQAQSCPHVHVCAHVRNHTHTCMSISRALNNDMGQRTSKPYVHHCCRHKSLIHMGGTPGSGSSTSPLEVKQAGLVKKGKPGCLDFRPCNLLIFTIAAPLCKRGSLCSCTDFHEHISIM
jgi:hypothetical protein